MAVDYFLSITLNNALNKYFFIYINGNYNDKNISYRAIFNFCSLSFLLASQNTFVFVIVML